MKLVPSSIAELREAGPQILAATSTIQLTEMHRLYRPNLQVIRITDYAAAEAAFSTFPISISSSPLDDPLVFMVVSGSGSLAILSDVDASSA